MSIPPQKMREIVLQLLYSLEGGLCNQDATVTLICGELAIGKQHVYRALERVRTIQTHTASIEAVIAEHSPSYAFGRIQSVERNILRLGVFELLHDSTVPPKVAISEAMRLTRKFSTHAASAFVNAVLDAIYRSSQGLNIDTQLLAMSTAALLESEEAASTAATMTIEEMTKCAS